MGEAGLTARRASQIELTSILAFGNVDAHWRERAVMVQWWRWALYQSSRCLAFRMVILGLCASAWPWKPISWNYRWRVLELTLLPEAVWNSVVSVSSEDRRLLRAMCFSPRRSLSVSLCGLPLCGWAVVTPRLFHFTITALTVDRGSSSRAEIWQTYVLERWHSFLWLYILMKSNQSMNIPISFIEGTLHQNEELDSTFYVLLGKVNRILKLLLFYVVGQNKRS
jgi:hypothetical protein